MSLNRYLRDCRMRLVRRFAARGAAAMALGALALTAGFAFIFITLVPAGGWVLTARFLLYAGLAAGTVLLVLRTPGEAGTASAVESRVPAFAGRLATWRDSTERGEASPLLELLRRETEEVARGHAPTVVVAPREVLIPAAAGVALVLALLLLLAFPFSAGGISPFQLAAQRLWTGDLFTAAAPRITVSPGDTVVPRGANVVVEAVASGFVPRTMEMHAAFENASAWETAPMSYIAGSRSGEDRYGFVFVGVTEEVEYYVGAAGLNSERHVIRVADLPRVTAVSVAYTFPEWTGAPVSERGGGDVAALPGTRVAITAVTDAPVADPLIVVNGEVVKAAAAGLVTSGAFEVGQPGTWHVALRHEGTLARISDSYFIDVVADKAPEVAFTWPGHDTQATAIEERALRFMATDDYGIEALELNYSVNGGAWSRAELEIHHTGDRASEHTLYLEELEIPPVMEGEAARSLGPGDMISFYAEAKDHTRQARTALYFVDVRPFDRTYRESQTMAGQGGQPGGGGPDELVQRQREIVSATWNLINEQEGEGGGMRADQAEVLALLQNTLKDQVITLIERAAARRLTLEEEINTFALELADAAEDMGAAADRLEAKALQEAIAPEQQALQHLLAAQATVTDVDVSMGQAEMRGTAGRSLSELMDLEMDRERNRYEMPQSPVMGDQAAEQSAEWQRLAKLAARQEQIARQQRLGQESLTSRWQQERLQRELERLQEALERRQQAQRNGPRQPTDDAIAELDRAREAIDRSLARPEGDPSATGQATAALRRAADALREAALGSMDERLARTERSVANLLADQRNIMQRLDDVQDDALNARDDEARRYDDYAMEPYAERKRRMQQDVNTVTREIGAMGEAIDDPETAHVLEQAVAELARERLDERLAASADAFEFGRPLYAVGNEAAVERALERLANRLDQARRLLESSEGRSGDGSALAEVRELRAELDQVLAGGSGQPGEDSGAGGSAFDSSGMEALLRQADALEFRLGQLLGEGLDLDTTLSRTAYRERGTKAANTAALAELMKDRLDLIEAALMNAGSAPIRAQEPRDQERDSEAAARYFRDLGRSGG